MPTLSKLIGWLEAYILSVACAVLLIVHLGLRYSGAKLSEGLDTISLGLVVVGLSPWIAKILSTTKIGGVEVQFRDIKNKVDEQRQDIDSIKFLIGHFLSKNELIALRRIRDDAAYMIDVNVFADEFKSELRHLRGLGFIDNFPDKGIRLMYEPDSSTTKRDVKKYFYITASGNQFLSLRREMNIV